jgi:hypothetical protein
LRALYAWCIACLLATKLADDCLEDDCLEVA